MTSYVTLGRSTFRVTHASDGIWITTCRKHGSTKGIPLDSELGQKIMAAHAERERLMVANYVSEGLGEV